LSSPASNPLYESALAYSKCGLSVIPAERSGNTKRPTVSWKPYTKRGAQDGELEEWFGPAQSMALVCGSVSGNLELLDFDLEGEAFQTWSGAVQSIAPGLFESLVIEKSPSGGIHVIYRCEDPIPGNRKLARFWFSAEHEKAEIAVGNRTYQVRHDPRMGGPGAWVTAIETRGEGGLFLCYPSPGYQLTQGAIYRPPVLTPDQRAVLVRCAAALNQEPARVSDDPSQSEREGRPGDDYNRRAGVRGLLERHGWRLVACRDQEYWCRPRKAGGVSATWNGEHLYVFTSNAPPLEPDTAYRPFALYAALEHQGDYAAAASALGRDGYGEPPQRPVPSDVEEAPPTRFEILSAGDLIRQYPRLRPPIVHGLLREGETCNIIAAPKMGKSWLTLSLALSVSSGRDWMNRYKCEPGSVLVIDNELHRETIAHRIPRVADAMGVAPREYEGLVDYAPLRGNLQDIVGLSRLFDLIEHGAYKMVVLDAWYRFLPDGKDENSNADIAGLFNRIDQYADQIGCAFCCVHHSSKGSQSLKSITDVGAGAGAQSRAVDCHIALRPHEEPGVVVFAAAARSWPPPEPVCLRWEWPIFTPDESLDPSELDGIRRGGNGVFGQHKKESKKEWTSDEFVSEFITDDPRSVEELWGRARLKFKGDAPGERTVRALVKEATDRGLIVQVRKMEGKSGAARGYIKAPLGH